MEIELINEISKITAVVIGEDVESTITGTTSLSIQIKTLLPSVAESLLREFRWAFANVTVPLLRFLDDEGGFQIPSGYCLFVALHSGDKKCNNCSNGNTFQPFTLRIENGRLQPSVSICDEITTHNRITYVSSIFNAGLASSEFKLLAAYSLALMLSEKYSLSEESRATIGGLREELRRTAKANELEEAAPAQSNHIVKREIVNSYGSLSNRRFLR